MKKLKPIVVEVGDDLQASYDPNQGKDWRVVVVGFTPKGRLDWGDDELHLEFSTLKRISDFVGYLEGKGYGKK